MFLSAHKIDNMASQFPESLSKAEISDINEKAIPKVMKFVLGVFQGKVLFVNIILRLNFHKRSRNCNTNTKQFIVNFQV